MDFITDQGSTYPQYHTTDNPSLIKYQQNVSTFYHLVLSTLLLVVLNILPVDTIDMA